MTDHGLNRDRSDQPGTPEKKFMHAFKKWLNFANIVGLFLGVITGLKILAGLITVRQFSIDLPVHTILSITLTLAVINLGLAYQTLAGVSLRPSVVWAMLAAILATTASFVRVSTTAAILMLPYCAWVCFATALNWAIWQMN